MQESRRREQTQRAGQRSAQRPAGAPGAERHPGGNQRSFQRAYRCSGWAGLQPPHSIKDKVVTLKGTDRGGERRNTSFLYASSTFEESRLRVKSPISESPLNKNVGKKNVNQNEQKEKDKPFLNAPTASLERFHFPSSAEAPVS